MLSINPLYVNLIFQAIVAYKMFHLRNILLYMSSLKFGLTWNKRQSGKSDYEKYITIGISVDWISKPRFNLFDPYKVLLK